MTNEDYEKLLGRAAARPGDPVLRAQVAIAAEPERVDEALNQAIVVTRTCLELSLIHISEPTRPY